MKAKARITGKPGDYRLTIHTPISTYYSPIHAEKHSEAVLELVSLCRSMQWEIESLELLGEIDG
jgi:hypothetical protein